MAEVIILPSGARATIHRPQAPTELHLAALKLKEKAIRNGQKWPK